MILVLSKLLSKTNLDIKSCDYRFLGLERGTSPGDRSNHLEAIPMNGATERKNECHLETAEEP